MSLKVSEKGSRWQIPIVVIAAGILWCVVTWVKWRLRKQRMEKYRLEKKKLDDFIHFQSTSGKTAAEALKSFHERQEAEGRAKMGKTLLDELEERQKNKGNKKKPTSGKYSAEMFEDSVSKHVKEVDIKKNTGDGNNNNNNKKSTDNGDTKPESDRYKSCTKTKNFVAEMGLKGINAKKGFLKKKDV